MNISERGLPPVAVKAAEGIFVGRADEMAVPQTAVAACNGLPRAVLVLVDDLQWADGPSARALPFAPRRLQADRMLVAVLVRPGELARLGEAAGPGPAATN